MSSLQPIVETANRPSLASQPGAGPGPRYIALAPSADAIPSSKRLRNAARLSGRILVTAGVLVLAWYTISFFSLFMY